MKLLAFNALALTLALSAAAVAQAYDADDFKGKFAGIDTTGIHGDHGIEMEGKMKVWFKTVTTTDDGDGGTLEGKFFYEGEHEDDEDTEDIVGVWFEDGAFHLIETSRPVPSRAICMARARICMRPWFLPSLAVVEAMDWWLPLIGWIRSRLASTCRLARISIMLCCPY